METFDIAYHLIGGQPLPIYAATQAIPAKKHIFFITQQSKNVAKRLQKILKDIPIELIFVDPYDLVALTEVFEQSKQEAIGKTVAIDATGGTKPMSIKLIQVFESIPTAKIFYVETKETATLLSFEDNTQQEIPSPLKTVEQFVNLHSDTPIAPKEEDDLSIGQAYRCSKYIWDIHTKESFRWHTTEFAKIKKHTKEKKRDFEAQFEKFRNLLIGTGMAEEAINTYVEENGTNYVKMSQYFGGGWLEDYVYRCLNDQKMFHKKFFDLRKNARIKFEDNKDNDIQELDLAFTDGIHLYIIECKSGDITQEYIQKLENITERYGGTYGRGIFCAAHKVTDERILERIRSSKNIMLVDDADIKNNLFDAIQNWRTGHYVKQ